MVAGRSQTNFGWETILQLNELRDKEEFIKDIESLVEPEIWFHDIFRRNGSAFSSKETSLIKQILQED